MKKTAFLLAALLVLFVCPSVADDLEISYGRAGDEVDVDSEAIPWDVYGLRYTLDRDPENAIGWTTRAYYIDGQESEGVTTGLRLIGESHRVKPFAALRTGWATSGDADEWVFDVEAGLLLRVGKTLTVHASATYLDTWSSTDVDLKTFSVNAGIGFRF